MDEKLEYEDVVRAIYAVWNEGDTNQFERFLTDDLEYTTSGLFPGFDPVYTGPGGHASLLRGDACGVGVFPHRAA